MSADDFVRDIEKVFLDHPLKVFPVAHYHLVEVCHFLESVLETWIPNWTLSTDINDLIKSSEKNPNNFIYKSLTRNSTVTLLGSA